MWQTERLQFALFDIVYQTQRYKWLIGWSSLFLSLWFCIEVFVSCLYFHPCYSKVLWGGRGVDKQFRVQFCLHSRFHKLAELQIPKHPLITAIIYIWLTFHKMCLFPLINHNNEADQSPNTYKYVMYIYTHIYSVYSMMVECLLNVYFCPRIEDLRKGIFLILLVTHVFV